MIKFTSFTLAFFITCLFVLSYATPVKDISSTTVGISKIHTSPSTERFVVAVQRVDDLVNDVGDLLVERISAVIINFDLRDEQLLVNNVPVPLGVNSIQVIEAQIIPENKDINKYETNFNNGLITVEVNTVAESLPTKEKGVSLRRVKISVHITEIDGAKVNQFDIIKKAFEFKSLETVDGGQNSGVAAMHIKSHSCSMINRLRHWWNSSSWLAHAAIIALLFTSFFGIFFIVVHNIIESFMASLYPRTRYQIICQNDDDDDSQVEKVIFIADEEKRALMKHETEKN